MKVSQLAPVPADAFWRVHFTANAPGGTSDRGDQFFVQARTDSLPSGAFVFGTATRDSNGAFTYTVRGNAAYGALDTANNEVVMRLSLASLDPYITHGPPVRPGVFLDGLRGSTGTIGASGARDATRGGGETRVCLAALAVEPRKDLEFGMTPPVPNPGRGGAAVSLSLPRAAWVELAVFDPQGRRVRTVHAGALPAGTTRFMWDGRTDGGHAAASGAYYLRMMAGGQTHSQHLVLVR
jgi:hypothetical protein